MLEDSFFTWSEQMLYDFGVYIDSKQFKRNVLHRKWLLEINLVERVAKDEVIRGYFSDNDTED